MTLGETRNVITAVATIATVVACVWYRGFATRRAILAQKNERTLHEKIVPRGGGITFGLAFALAALALGKVGVLHPLVAAGFGVGGLAATLVGFLDDTRGMRPLVKLALHATLSAWAVLTLVARFVPPYADIHGVAQTIGVVALALFVPVWLINLWNFIDGIDGLAIGGATVLCGTLLVVLGMTRDPGTEVDIVWLLLGCCAAFLPFNLPPARMFMGDAGSIFLGYSIAALLIITVAMGTLSPLTWIAMLAYFIADTTTTSLSRMWIVRGNWFHVHRSHAYQNLARIGKSHAKVTYGILAYQLLVALPMAVWSVRAPQFAWLAATIAVTPAVLWTLRFGPPLSID